MITRREPLPEGNPALRHRSPTAGGKRGKRPVAVVRADRPREIRRETAEKVRAANAPRWGRFLSSLSLVLLTGGGLFAVHYVLGSSRFRISQIQISSVSSSVSQEIVDAIAPGCKQKAVAGSGEIQCQASAPGPSIFVLDTTQAAHGLEQLPAIKSATIRTVLPNRVVVQVTERVPEAAWVIGPRVFQVASDGTVLGEGSAQGLKVIIGDTDGGLLKPGDHVDQQVISGAEQLHNDVSKQAGVSINRIEYSAANGLAVIADQGMIVIFGPAEGLGLKVAELESIMQLAKDQKINLGFVDLRYKTPYYRAR